MSSGRLTYSDHPNPSKSSMTPCIAPRGSETISTNRIFRVPYERNPFFVGREELFEEIRVKLEDDRKYKHRVVCMAPKASAKHKYPLNTAFDIDISTLISFA